MFDVLFRGCPTSSSRPTTPLPFRASNFIVGPEAMPVKFTPTPPSPPAPKGSDSFHPLKQIATFCGRDGGKLDRAPAVDPGARRSCSPSARVRHPCGTREGPLRAASFRT